MKILMAILVGAAMASGNDTTLAVGDAAPDFTLLDEQGKTHTLSDYRGQKVVVYFYPKDDTPGCTKEACNFRDHFVEFNNRNIKILGISYDSAESHRRFKEKFDLPFTLLSDEDKKVAELYGSAGLFVPKRVTFLIDEEGRIVHIYEKVDVTTHGEEILKFFLPDEKKS